MLCCVLLHHIMGYINLYKIILYYHILLYITIYIYIKYYFSLYDFMFIILI